MGARPAKKTCIEDVEPELEGAEGLNEEERKEYLKKDQMRKYLVVIILSVGLTTTAFFVIFGDNLFSSEIKIIYVRPGAFVNGTVEISMNGMICFERTFVPSDASATTKYYEVSERTTGSEVRLQASESFNNTSAEARFSLSKGANFYVMHDGANGFRLVFVQSRVHTPPA